MYIIHLCTDWADVLVAECWKWNHGQEPPLRLLCEIGMILAAWFNYTPYYIEDSQKDWQTNTPSWLVIPGYPLGENKLIKRLDYSGWVWEPESINGVSVANKYDEAKIDVSLWDVGVKGEHM